MRAADVVKVLRLASERLADLFGDEFVGLVLFGSRARGEAGDYSDVDVLVVFRSLGGFDVRGRVYGVIAECVRMPITLVDVRLDEIASEDFELTPLMLNILYDGVIVWDRDGLLRDFFERGRKLIEKANLIRYRTRDGKYGWMRADGKPIAHYKIVLESE